MLLGFLRVIFCFEDRLVQLSGKSVQIFLTNSNTTYLSYGEDNVSVRAVQLPERRKGKTNANLNTVFKLLKSGTRYMLFDAEKSLCTVKNILGRCVNADLWEIKPIFLGYTIGSMGKCLTLKEDRRIRKEKCTGDKSQVFDFEEVENIRERHKKNGVLIDIKLPEEIFVVDGAIQYPADAGNFTYSTTEAMHSTA